VSSNGWIGVDLDGTLAHYEGEQGVHHIGVPIPLMVGRVRKWLAEGKEVRIMTARVSGADSTDDVVRRDAEKARTCIKLWCSIVFGQVLAVTHRKDFKMIELWDDRVVRVELNTGKVMSESEDRPCWE